MVSGEETLTEPVVVKNEDLAMEKVRQALNKFEGWVLGEGIENIRQEAGQDGLLEAMGMKGKVRWVENLKQIMEEIGWVDVEM